MREIIVLGGNTGNGHVRLAQNLPRWCGVFAGTTITLGDTSTSSAVEWAVSSSVNRDDFAQFADAVLPAGLWTRKDGYYLFSINVRVDWGSNTPMGKFKAFAENNSTAADWLCEWENYVHDTSVISFDMVGGDWFTAGSYMNLRFVNNTGFSCDISTRALAQYLG